MGRRTDLKMYAQAINNNWPISAEVRKAIIDECLRIVQGQGGGKYRERMRAMEILAKFDMLNFQRENMQLPKMKVNFSVPYEQMTADDNDQIVDALVSGVDRLPDRSDGVLETDGDEEEDGHTGASEYDSEDIPG